MNTGAFDPFGAARSPPPERPARGCTSTAPSGCGPPPRRGAPTWWRESATPTRWPTDAHKWLNVALRQRRWCSCAEPEHLRAAMAATRRLPHGHASDRAPGDYTPEMSRRARGVEVWAALRSLGRSGLADLVERCCRHATRFADGLRAAGHEVLNEVDAQPGAGVVRRRRDDPA